MKIERVPPPAAQAHRMLRRGFAPLLGILLLAPVVLAQNPPTSSTAKVQRSVGATPAQAKWDVYISAGDSWWLGNKWLPIDSPGSIRDSVRMWSEVLNIKRVYWRGQQEEMMIDFGLIRKENLVSSRRLK